MRIAVINEVSAVARNGELVSSLEGRGHEVINAGMKTADEKPELTYIHTGFLAALLLNAGRADFVVGGCGTGQGFLNSVMQYPGVACGLISSPVEAWLFARINGGNCVSLPLLYGYGWAGDIALRFIFDRLFSAEFGTGYPEHRRESQMTSRKTLSEISKCAHRPFAEIVDALPDSVVRPALSSPRVIDLLKMDSLGDDLKKAINKRM